MKSYNYKNRKGVKEISWEEFQALCQALAEKIAAEEIDLVLGIARGGLYPATLISGMLRREFYPLRITRRNNDIVEYQNPQWKTDVTDNVNGKRILIIDDIADNGETLLLVSGRAKEKGAKYVKTLSLVTHTWANPKPNYFGIESDKLIIFPWDTKIFMNGKWKLHPELEEAIKLQK